MDTYEEVKTQEFVLGQEPQKEVSIFDTTKEDLECWLETDLDMDIFYFATQAILRGEENQEELEAVNLALGFNPEHKQYNLKEIKENMGLKKIEKAKSLRNDALRKLRYNLWEGELDTERFTDLTLFHPYDEKAESWDLDGLDSLPISNDVEKEKIIEFLNPKEDITYKEAEFLLKDDPNTLISAMILLTNKYQREIALTKEEDADAKHFLFSHQEETIFFTGLTLLNEFNNAHEDEFVQDLIKTTKGIIYKHNIGLIKKNLSKYLTRASKDSFQDLFQQGSLGLIYSMDKFDIDLGNKFSTYATWWIRRDILMGIRDMRTITFPRWVELYLNRIDNAVEKIKQEKGDQQPSTDEIITYCKEHNIDIPDREKVEHVLNLRYIYSLDKETDDESKRNLYSKIPADFNLKGKTEKVEAWSKLREILNNVPFSQREEKVINLHFGLETGNPKPYTQIQKVLGVSNSTLFSARNRAFEKIKEYLSYEDLTLQDFV